MTEAPSMPGVELVHRNPDPVQALAAAPGIMSDDEIRRTFRVAQALAASKMFKDAEQAEQAFAKILIGRDLGIGPTKALMTVDLVEGSIQLRGVLLAGFLREHPTYDYRLEDHDATACTCVIERKRDDAWSDAGSWTFTVEDARTAGLIPEASKRKAAWNAHRKNMLMWRAIANAVRAHAPDVFGGVPVYVEGELEVRRDELTTGTGDGEATGLDLGPKVEKILARAAELGHAGIADRATAELTLGAQSPGFVEQWCVNASKVLDDLEAERRGDDPEVADADVVEPTPEQPIDPRPEGPEVPVEVPAGDPIEAANRAEQMRDEADALATAADEAESEGQAELAADLRGQADALRAEADATATPGQGTLDLS